jgi:hypothetical protein
MFCALYQIIKKKKKIGFLRKKSGKKNLKNQKVVSHRGASSFKSHAS